MCCIQRKDVHINKTIHTNENMQTIKYTSGIWNIETTVQKIDDRNRLAMVSAMAGTGDAAIESKHTVVFEHVPGCDEADEAKIQTLRVMTGAH
jgi:hypothetical protein